MKKTVHIKSAKLLVPFLVTILLFPSCEANKIQEDTKVIAEERNDEKFDKNEKKKDAQFLVNAAEINLKQIHLGQLAQRKGSSENVKELGKILEDDNTKSLTDLTAFAKSKNISIPSLPTDNSTKTYLDLNEKSGNDFDKAYANMMVFEHADAIEIFEDASEDCNDEDIRKWAIISLPHLKKHLDRSIQSQKELDNMYIAKNKQYKVR